MPAFQLSQLKTQAARLAEKFDDPDRFVHDLNELLGYYTNRTIRSAQVARRLSVPTFHTPRPVMRQIELELALFAEARPEKAVILLDILWNAESLESRLLSAYLMGILPPAQAARALLKLPKWLNQTSDNEIRFALLDKALARLRHENPADFYSMLEDWLSSHQTTHQIWGMQALIPLLHDSQFENLPAVFRILRPAILNLGPITQLDFQACLEALDNVSRTETISYMREIIHENPPPLMLRVFRRILPALSQELQTAFRGILRDEEADYLNARS
jgi:hypothetical protein